MSGPSCPTCGDECTSERGVKIHHARVHGESIAGVEVDCTHCGETMRRSPSKAEAVDRPFCSQGCQGAWRSENFQGDANPAWKGGLAQLECANCGGDIERVQARADAYDRHFCDWDCKTEFLDGRTGEQAGAWEGGRSTYECAHCGADVDRYESELEPRGQKRVFCDTECKASWMSEQWTDEDHPGWKGGPVDRDWSVWKELRKGALERDGDACRRCGMTREQHREEYGRDIHVHHIVPVREFESIEAASDLDNLMTVCEGCHWDVEGVDLAVS